MANETRLEIRPATPADAEAIVAFNAAMARETEGKELELARLSRGVAAVFADPALGEYWVAERGGDVVGGLLLTYEWSDWRDGRFWWIQSVYVRPEARGGGVYTALYRAIESRARETPGVCGLRLYVDHGNERAQRVYEHLGMEAARYRFYEVDFVLDP